MNIYDIAKEAGVSISTVSRVLNNKSYVNPDTRGKIQAILDKHQYSPNAMARGLAVNSMKAVAVFTVDLRVPHYALTAYTVEREFSKIGYHVLVCNTSGELEETQRYARDLIKTHVDGVVLIGSVFDKLARDPEVATSLQNIPVVIANGQLDLPNSYSVLVDDMYGIGLAIEHLQQKGHRDIVYIKDLDTESAIIKQKGFIAGLEKQGLGNGKANILTVPYGLKGGEEAAERILSRAKRPTALVCGEDLTAVGVMKGLSKAGLHIPADIAVTGYNNSDYSRICTPELTTVDNKGEMSAHFCVQLLESRINGENIYSSMSIRPELAIRQST
jgi:LacI family transcriptional regulator